MAVGELADKRVAE